MSTIEAPRPTPAQEAQKEKTFDQKYRALALKFHPDKKGGDSKKFLLAQQAYEEGDTKSIEALYKMAFPPDAQPAMKEKPSTLESVSGESSEVIQMMLDLGYTPAFLKRFYHEIAEAKASAQSVCNLVNSERIRHGQPELTEDEKKSYIESEVAKIRKEMLDEFSRNDRAQAA